VLLVVIVIPLPANNVSVSALLSATTLLCPATAIVEKLVIAAPATPAALALAKKAALAILVRSALASLWPPDNIPSYSLRVLVV
jgi:hypothetical protein